MEFISSRENKKIKYIKKLISSSSLRRDEGLFAAEGLRLCEDALRSEAKVEIAVFSRSFAEKSPDFISESVKLAAETLFVSDGIFSALSDTKTPQGVLFVVKRLDKTFDFDKMKNNGKVLALERIQDPVNLGTVLRTAEAFGAYAVVLSSDCCDVYSPKVVRGSMGAVFRLPVVITDDLPGFIRRFNSVGSSFAAVLDKNSVSLSACSFSGKAMAVIGNEGNGLTSNTVSACSYKLYIPMSGRAESLNAAVAASIILWEMMK